MDERVQKADYEKLLEICFSDPKIKFVKAEYKPVSDKIIGFMGVHLKLYLTYEQEGLEFTKQFFVKTKPFHAIDEHPSKAENLFDKEIFMYDYLFREFEKLGYDIDFSPKCYLCIKDHTLIMEDLTQIGFELSEKRLAHDKSKVKCTLKSLAKLHAAGFAYEKVKSAELGRPFFIGKEFPNTTNEVFYNQYVDKKRFACSWFNTNIKYFPKLVDLLPDNEEFKTKFKNLLEKTDFGKIMIENYNLKKTCTHGDLWTNNMMFKLLGNEAVESRLLDYQLNRYFYPAFDVALAIHYPTNASFIQNNVEEMYQYYYDTLAATLTKYGCSINEILPFEDYRKSLRICKPEALAFVAAGSCLIYMPPDMTQYETELAVGFEIKEGVTLEQKIEECVSKYCPIAYKKDKLYRNVVYKCLHNLCDALEERFSEEN